MVTRLRVATATATVGILTGAAEAAAGTTAAADQYASVLGTGAPAGTDGTLVSGESGSNVVTGGVLPVTGLDLLLLAWLGLALLALGIVLASAERRRHR